MAMNEHCGKPLNDTRLLALMGELEGRISGSIHYDNVAPCFLGGMQLMIEENDIISQQVPGLMSGCGCWRIRGLKSRRQKPGYFTGAVSPPGLHCARATSGRLHSRLLFPSA